MTVRISTGLRNFLSQGGSIKDFLEGAQIRLYNTAQLSSPDTSDASLGTCLAVVTDTSLTHTGETVSSGTLTLTGGGSGSVNTVTVNGINILGTAVSFNSDLSTTATDVAAQINAYKSVPNYEASASGAVITIKAMAGTGASPNGFVVAATYTTITGSTANMSGGVNAANGITFGAASAGVMSKTGIWSASGLVTGVPQSFRIVRNASDATGLSTTALRLDGSVSSLAADLNITPCSVTASQTLTIDQFDVTVPAE